MIEINIKTNGKIVMDSINTEKTTLTENALMLGRLEEIKIKLLNFDYHSEFEVEEK